LLLLVHFSSLDELILWLTPFFPDNNRGWFALANNDGCWRRGSTLTNDDWLWLWLWRWRVVFSVLAVPLYFIRVVVVLVTWRRVVPFSLPLETELAHAVLRWRGRRTHRLSVSLHAVVAPVLAAIVASRRRAAVVVVVLPLDDTVSHISPRLTVVFDDALGEAVVVLLSRLTVASALGDADVDIVPRLVVIAAVSLRHTVVILAAQRLGRLLAPDDDLLLCLFLSES
jgi:hypothetical protein